LARMAFMTEAADCRICSGLFSETTMEVQVAKKSAGFSCSSPKMVFSACCRCWLLCAVVSACMISSSTRFIDLYKYTKQSR
jgi:hypothetical protein